MPEVNRLIKLKPQDAKLYFLRAEIYSDLLFVNEAKSDLNKAIELDPALRAKAKESRLLKDYVRD